ncbi:TetR/AcrR family transcriptional regulator [uncultured Litoreibacter sp.]|uniref:TetR/AcrR family transcriptional regulator n=1 Tax=uncultured Litoreibacter sp. TaxID=1392394 RepID=UPI0026309DC5|nr:TetR/AcrR family transcriptional regulator [uncultured Litoreibacter sp.]
MAKPSTETTQEKILTAANKLFYAEGIRAVSVDAIAEKAGLTKRTLYYHFKSKDDLIKGYLVSRDQPNLLAFANWYNEAEGSAADRTAAIFRHVAQNARHPKWKGCGFLRTVAELANMPGHPAVAVGAAHKKKFEAWLSERYADAGIEEASAVARSVALLMDGAFSAMLTFRDPQYADDAGKAASSLVALASTEPKNSQDVHRSAGH